MSDGAPTTPWWRWAIYVRFPSLIELLGHSDMHTRAIAASALGKLGSTEPVDPLVELFKDRNAGIRDTSRPQEHIQTDRDREANPDCLNALDRAWAAEALGRLGDMRAFQPLMNAADDPIGGVRACAVGALGALGDSRAYDRFIAALRDEDEGVRYRAVISLGKLGDIRAVEHIMGVVCDESRSVRRASADVGQVPGRGVRVRHPDCTAQAAVDCVSGASCSASCFVVTPGVR